MVLKPETKEQRLLPRQPAHHRHDLRSGHIRNESRDTSTRKLVFQRPRTIEGHSEVARTRPIPVAQNEAYVALLQSSSARGVIGPSGRARSLSDFKGRHFEGEIVLWAVRWCCRYGVSYRD